MKTNISQKLSFLLMALIIASGCGEDSIILPVQDPHWTQNVESYVIPFEIIDNKIIMDANINGIEGNICYEVNREGIEFTTYFLNKLAPGHEELEVYNNEYDFNLSDPIHFEIGDFTLDLTSEDHIFSLNSQIGQYQHVLAFIGRDFFKNYEISIDYTTKVIMVSPSSKYPPGNPLFPAK